MRTIFSTITMNMPTKADIENLKVGDLAPASFGPSKKVIEIIYRGTDVNGKAYVGYYVELSPTSSLSHSLQQDRISRDLSTTKAFSSHELDLIEEAHQPA